MQHQSLPGDYAQRQQMHHQQLLTSLLQPRVTPSQSIPSTHFMPNELTHDPKVYPTKTASVSSLESSFLASPLSTGSNSLSGSSTHSAHKTSAYTMPPEHAYPPVLQDYDLDFGSMQMPWSVTSPAQDQNTYYGQMFDDGSAVDQTWVNATLPHANVIQANSAATLGLDLGHFLFQETQRQNGMSGTIQPDLLGAPSQDLEKFGVDPQKLQQQTFNPMIIKSDLSVELDGDAEGEEDDDRLTEYHGSPSRSASSSESSHSASAISSRKSRAHRYLSEGELHLPPMNKHKRKNTWSAGLFDSEPLDADARERALELLEAESGGCVNRKDRRRVQNRLAQRAFRARSKVHKQELSDYMIHLETLTDAQEERLLKMHALIERLQKENTCLKMNSWQAIQAGGNVAGASHNKTGSVIEVGMTAVA